MRSIAIRLIAAIALIAAAGLWLTQPKKVDADLFNGLTTNAENGALVFAAAGCASCHVSESGSEATLLGGGKRFASPFGTFIAPNISPDPVQGIGGWSDVQIASAIRYGTGYDGEHLFPAFPYNSYVKVSDQDLYDLIWHLRTLPQSDQANEPHEVPFPFNIRLSLGGWKLLFVDQDWIVDGTLTDAQERGRDIVEGLAHCGECHTPRNRLGGLVRSAWLSGAPNPSGEGTIPDITADALDWSDSDVASYLKTGFTPEFDTAGGSMAAVVRNLARLPDSDISAIVSYLRLVP